jgi:hypothetical protein
MNIFTDDHFVTCVYDLEDLPDNPLRDLGDMVDNCGGVLAAWRIPHPECRYMPTVVLLTKLDQVEVFAPNGTVTQEELATILNEAAKQVVMLEVDDEPEGGLTGL